MKKIIELSHITLTPALLYGTTDAIATHGKIHAQAISLMQHEGKEYASADDNERPDVLIGIPDLAAVARDLFAGVAQQLANDAGCAVRYKVNGEARTVEPQPK